MDKFNIDIDFSTDINKLEERVQRNYQRWLKSSEGIIHTTAQACHEVNRKLCAQNRDYSQPVWDMAPEWQRKAALDGVRAHFTSTTPLTPEQSHELWLNNKETDGWVYGPEKDEAKKTHPCMLPYDQLPKEQQLKDYAFSKVVERCKPAYLQALKEENGGE